MNPDKPVVNDQHSPRSRWQFSLGGLLGAMLVCAVLFALVGRTHEVYKLSGLFSTMPADDQRLVDWLQAQEGIEDPSVVRQGDRLRIRYTRRQPLPAFAFVTPPFKELGYTAPQKMDWSVTRPSPVGILLISLAKIPIVGWLVAAAIAAGIVLYRARRTVAQKAPTAEVVR
jgi:hypothetical protein